MGDALYREKMTLQSRVASMGLELDTVRASITKHASHEQGLFAEKTNLKQMLDDLTRAGIEKEERLNTVTMENGKLCATRDALAYENSQLGQKSDKLEAEVSS